jgi:peptide/nickel transport system ATP-binding protein
MPLVEAKELSKHFPTQRSPLEGFLSKKEYVHAVDGVSFQIEKMETFGIVGESGSGKTTTGRLLLRLINPTSGIILFDGEDITQANSRRLQHLRREAQMIFQDPMAALSPRMAIGDAIGDGLNIHNIGTRSERRHEVLEILERVGLSPSRNFYEKYPHQLSGGQRQRAVIGRAMILKPKLVVADEPVAMVDVSIRVQILDLMASLKAELGLTYVFITHDLATANHFCDRIAIMYLGEIVEMGSRDQVFLNPKHPYTVALMSAIPVPNPKHQLKRIIPKGEIPSPIHPPSGCRFHPRCPYAFDKCTYDKPRMTKSDESHLVACHLFETSDIST